MKKINIGVFGGRRGNDFINISKFFENVFIVAVCEKDLQIQKKIKEANPDVKIFDDFDEFINYEMDAVILANYATEHAPFAIKAMKKGKNVLSEVMPCQCLKEAVELVECVEKTKMIYAYGENYCYMPATREMKRLFDEGTLGTFEYGEGEYIHNCEPIWSDLTYGEQSHWRNNVYASFYCTHSIGPILHITGLRPEFVTGFEFPYTKRMALMGLKRGMGAIEMIKLSNGAYMKSIHSDLDKDSVWFSIYGSKGEAESSRLGKTYEGVNTITINIDEKEGVYQNQKKTYDLGSNEFKSATNAHNNSDYYLFKEFVSKLRGFKEADIIDIYEALDMFLPGLFAYFSILDGGKPKRVPNMRLVGDRNKYRNDTRCCDVKIAKDQLLPLNSVCDVVVPERLYENMKMKYEQNQKKEN